MLRAPYNAYSAALLQWLLWRSCFLFFYLMSLSTVTTCSWNCATDRRPFYIYVVILIDHKLVLMLLLLLLLLPISSKSLHIKMLLLLVLGLNYPLSNDNVMLKISTLGEIYNRSSILNCIHSFWVVMLNWSFSTRLCILLAVDMLLIDNLLAVLQSRAEISTWTYHWHIIVDMLVMMRIKVSVVIIMVKLEVRLICVFALRGIIVW